MPMQIKMVVNDPDFYGEKEVDVKLPATFQSPDVGLAGREYSGILVDSDTGDVLVNKKIEINGVLVATTASDGSFSYTMPRNTP